jgi:hypothetical protein
MSEPRDIIAELDAMLKEAGLHACLCFTCSHKREYGPCRVCGCANDGTKRGTVEPHPQAKEGAE